MSRSCSSVTARRSGAAPAVTRRTPTSRSRRTAATRRASSPTRLQGVDFSLVLSSPRQRARDDVRVRGARTDQRRDHRRPRRVELRRVRGTHDQGRSAPRCRVGRSSATARPGGETADGGRGARRSRARAGGRGRRCRRAVLARALPPRARRAAGSVSPRRRARGSGSTPPPSAASATNASSASCGSGTREPTVDRRALALVTVGRRLSRRSRPRPPRVGAADSRRVTRRRTRRWSLARAGRACGGGRRRRRASPSSVGSTRSGASTAAVVRRRPCSGVTPRRPARSRWQCTTPPACAPVAASSCSAAARGDDRHRRRAVGRGRRHRQRSSGRSPDRAPTTLRRGVGTTTYRVRWAPTAPRSLPGILRTTDGATFTPVGALPVPVRVSCGRRGRARDLPLRRRQQPARGVDTRRGAALRHPTGVDRHRRAAARRRCRTRARSCCAAQMYLLGGYVDNTRLSDQILRFDPADRRPRPPPAARRLPVSDAAAVVVDGRGYLVAARAPTAAPAPPSPSSRPPNDEPASTAANSSPHLTHVA